MFIEIIKSSNRQVANKGCKSIFGGELNLLLLKVFFYHENETKNIEQLDEFWESQVPQLSSSNFSDGITGYGWVLEWLSRNNYIDVDTNEILEEFDDIIYKSYIYGNSNNLSLIDGLAGKVFYLYQRYLKLAQNGTKTYYRRLGVKECIIDISNTLLDLIKSSDYLENFSIDLHKWYDIYNILAVFNHYQFSSLNFKIEEQIIHSLIKYIESILKKYIYPIDNAHARCLLCLANIYYRIGKNVQIQLWEHRGEFWCKEVLMQSFNDSCDISLNIIKLLTLKTLNLDNSKFFSKEYFEFTHACVREYILNKLENGWEDHLTGKIQFSLLTLLFLENDNDKRIEEYLYCMITLGITI